MTGSLGGAGLAFGVEAEFGVSTLNLETLKDGVIGVSVRAHTFSQSVTYSSSGEVYSETWRISPVVVSVNYHLPLSEPRLDPYAGLGIGYASVSYSNNVGQSLSVNAGAYLLADAGLRFGLTPNVALQGGISVGSRGDVGLLRIAAMFKP
jgi:outer membrane protein W